MMHHRKVGYEYCHWRNVHILSLAAKPKVAKQVKMEELVGNTDGFAESGYVYNDD